MMTAGEIIAWLSKGDPDIEYFVDGQGLQLVSHNLVHERRCEVGGHPVEVTAPRPPPVPPLTADQRWEKGKRLEAICERLNLEHTTSCYEEQVGNSPDRETFWVCVPGCPTNRAHSVLASEGEGAAP